MIICSQLNYTNHLPLTRNNIEIVLAHYDISSNSRFSYVSSLYAFTHLPELFRQLQCESNKMFVCATFRFQDTIHKIYFLTVSGTKTL